MSALLSPLLGVVAGLVTWWFKSRQEAKERRTNAVADRWRAIETEAVKECSSAIAELIAALGKAVDDIESSESLSDGWGALRFTRIAYNKSMAFLPDDVGTLIAEAEQLGWVVLNSVRLIQEGDDERRELIQRAHAALKTLGIHHRTKVRRAFREMLLVEELEMVGAGEARLSLSGVEGPPSVD